MSTQLQETSKKQGGGGVAVQGQTPITAFGTPVSLGKSAGAGTNCAVYLTVGNDAAYGNAILSFYVYMQGFAVLYATETIDPAVAIAQANVVFATGGVAAEEWEVFLTLAGPTLPAQSVLRSSIIASGVENTAPTGGSGGGPIVWQNTYTGPSHNVTVNFGVPLVGETTTFDVLVEARVMSSGVDPVGASISTVARYAWENVAGAVALVPVSLSAPDTSFDALWGAFTSSVGASGAHSQVHFGIPAGIDPSTVTEVTISLIPLVADP